MNFGQVQTTRPMAFGGRMEMKEEKKDSLDAGDSDAKRGQ